ncbi:VanZ family protein [Saccharopolyspora griseoalba]|uniref:VanZ family protein n=1 Tax=Saccharopolyspora griseoalba TaxID=1431848 RepID=A0ABW2LE28_9PSEU
MDVLPGAIAAVLGTALAALLFPSFVAGEYRRRGGLRAEVALRRYAALLYATALGCYVLLPTGGGCFAAQLLPLAGLTGGGGLLQFASNIALFVPLGALPARGSRFAAAAGLAASLLIEVTQLTGLWFSFPCPYRVFDVNDVIANTLGALLGGFVPLRPLDRARCASDPVPVTAGRRLLGMCCDGLLLGWLAVAAGGPDRPAWLPAALVLLAATLPTGTTLGQRLVLLRAHRPTPVVASLRWASGCGGLAAALTCGPLLGAPAPLAAGLWCAAHAAGVICDRDRRGITGLLSGLELHDMRAPTTVRPREAGWDPCGTST